MKKYGVILAALLLVAGSVLAQVAGAVFGWADTLQDLGRIRQGKPVAVVYTFTNTGGVPLVVASAKGSCGCTGVEWPKAAVLPGATGSITATFNAAAAGAFNKTVRVESNADGGPVTLVFKGEVIAEGTATTNGR